MHALWVVEVWRGMMSMDLHLGDCYDILPSIESASVDLILTDPSYGLRAHARGNISIKGRKVINNEIAEWDKPADIHMLAHEFRRIIKPTGNIFIFCDVNTIGEWETYCNLAFHTFTFMVWKKTNPTPSIRKTNFLKACELCLCMWDKGHVWNFTTQKDMHNMMEFPTYTGRDKRRYNHPTQKPTELFRKIVQIASNPGDLVFDPFMGTGTTGVAAQELGREFMGIEIREDYFRIASERILYITHNKLDSIGESDDGA